MKIYKVTDYEIFLPGEPIILRDEEFPKIFSRSAIERITVICLVLICCAAKGFAGISH